MSAEFPSARLDHQLHHATPAAEVEKEVDAATSRSRRFMALAVQARTLGSAHGNRGTNGGDMGAVFEVRDVTEGGLDDDH